MSIVEDQWRHAIPYTCEWKGHWEWTIVCSVHLIAFTYLNCFWFHMISIVNALNEKKLANCVIINYYICIYRKVNRLGGFTVFINSNVITVHLKYRVYISIRICKLVRLRRTITRIINYGSPWQPLNNQLVPKRAKAAVTVLQIFSFVTCSFHTIRSFNWSTRPPSRS